MPAEDSVVLFVFFLAWVERPKVFLLAYDVVAGPLVRKRNEGCVAKEFRVFLVDGGAPASFTRGRAILRAGKVFDCTMGYPGEDVICN